jgi:hypothetical protein
MSQEQRSKSDETILVLVIGASVLLALGRETVPAGIRPPS